MSRWDKLSLARIRFTSLADNGPTIGLGIDGMTTSICDKCGNPGVESGDIETKSGKFYLVLQCSTCTEPWEFDGQTFTTAKTWTVETFGAEPVE